MNDELNTLDNQNYRDEPDTPLDPNEYYNRDVREDNLKNSATPKNIYFNALNYQKMFEIIFSDVKPDSILVGPTEKYGLTLSDIINFNYGERGKVYFDKIINSIGWYNGAINNDIKLRIRYDILNYIAKCIESNNINFNNFISPRVGTFTLLNVEKSKKETIENIKLFERLCRREGKIGICDYEIKFSYKIHNEIIDKEDMPVFIDSEGKCFIIKPMVDTSLNEGIYILKITPYSKMEEPFITLPIPIEGLCTKSELLNGVFFSSYHEFKQIYKKEYKTTYEESFEDNKIYNLKKLVGSYLYCGITETSHGFVSWIKGYSLTRENFWICSPETGVSEIINITPKNVDSNEFINSLNEVGLTKDLLTEYDYLIRKVNVGSGSGKVISKNIRIQKIKLRKSNIHELKNSIMDQDLSIFLETGIAVFSTKEAAERCVLHSGGDYEKYIHYITSKLSSKGEKRVIVDNIKNAILVGIGAVIPKIIEEMFTKKKQTKKESNESMSIMKGMLPPMAAGFVSFASIANKVMNHSNFNFKSFGNMFNKIYKGVRTMSFIKSVGNFIGKIFNKAKEFVKNTDWNEVGRKTWSFVKSVGKGIIEIGEVIWGKLKSIGKILFDSDLTFLEKIKTIFSGTINTSKEVLTWITENFGLYFNKLLNFGRKIFSGIFNFAKGVFA